MQEEYIEVLTEMRDMLKLIMERQNKLIEDVNQLKAEQKRLAEEIKLSNFVLNNFTLRNEIIN